MIDLKEIGITQEELQERIVNQAVDRLFSSCGVDDEGNSWPRASEFMEQCEKTISNRIMEITNEIAERHLTPRMNAAIESMVIQQYSQYGSKQGEPVSFPEFLVKIAKEYMEERVDSDGRNSRVSCHGSCDTPRIMRVVDKHLRQHLDDAMKQIIANANAVLVENIKTTLLESLKDVAARLKVSVK